MRKKSSKDSDQISNYNINEASSKEKRNNRVIKFLWGAFLGIGLFICVFMLLIYNGVIGYMPPIEELEDPHDKLASVLLASDGETELGRFFGDKGNRVYSDYDKISPQLIEALLATEDVRFYDHSGIDFRALGRTFFKTLLMGDKSSGGASTITQQLAKQLYSQPSSSLWKRAFQKPIEWMIAIKLERFYTKDEIINMYLNRFDFLNNAVGIKTAANVYFGKDPDKLTVPEAALLVGMLKNPSYYNPLRFKDRALNRRNVVLDQMVKAGYIDAAQGELYKSQDLGINYHKVDHRDGTASYFREEIRKMLTAPMPVRPKRADFNTHSAYQAALGRYNTDSTQWKNNPLYGWVEKNPRPDGSHFDIYSDGLKIYTTIDPTMQRYAEEAVYEWLGGTLQTHFSAEKKGNPYNSYTNAKNQKVIQQLIRNSIKNTKRYQAMKKAGASEEEIEKEFRTPYQMDIFTYEKKGDKIVPGTKTVTMTPYDSLMYMKTMLRIGMMSMDPHSGHVKAYVGGPDFYHFQYDMVSTGRRQIGSTAKPFLYTLAMEQDFTPCSHLSGSGATLKWALTNSNNATSLALIKEMSPLAMVNKMRAFGITGYINKDITLALGTADVSVKEMVAAYSAFANKGLRVEPIFVTRIEDNQGNILFSATPRRTEATSEEAYYKILTMLMSVVDHGTGRPLRGGRFGISAQMGGKTGTTNDNSDTWFMGFTPELVSGVWIGGEERYIHFNTMALGQGARAALPVWGLYMKKVFADPKLPYSQSTKFEFPEDFKACDGEEYKTGTPIFTAPGVVEVEEAEGIFD